jgi:putative membrane protein
MMNRIAYNAGVALVLLVGFGCDQAKKNTEKKQPEEEVLAEAAAKQGYGEDAARPGVDSRLAEQPLDTTQFAVRAASGSLMEVILGELAEHKGANVEVKEFGLKMAADHKKANEELQSLAGKHKISLPIAPLAKHQKHIDDLEPLSGSLFDKAYMGMMVQAHQQDIAEFEKAAQGSQEKPEIKAFAQKTLPVLQKHLELARKTLADVQKATAKTL